MNFFHIRTSIWLLILGLVLCSHAVTDEPWELMKEADGVKVFTRKHAGTKLLEFKAVTIVSARLSSLVSVVKDLEDATELFAAIEAIELVQEIDDYEWVARATLNTPFPLDDREMVIRMILKQDSLTYRTTMSIINAPEAIPLDAEIIRLPLVEGSFDFYPIDSGQTEVIYQTVSDPAGNIPAWLINLATVKAPFTTMNNLKLLAKKEYHANKKLSYIQEKF